MLTKSKNLTPKDFNLDHPLIRFSDDQRDWWTLRDAVRGVQIFGGIGSGKSSGSGKKLALSFLESGFGGIVLTGKIDETEQWLSYADQTGRLKDVVIFGARREMSEEEQRKDKYYHMRNKEYKFNPLQYEMDRPKKEGGGETDNIVALFTAIIKMGNRLSGAGGGSSDDPFWDMALQRCIKASVDLLKLAGEDITVFNITKIIRQAPVGENLQYEYYSLVTSDNQSDYEKLQEWADQSFTIYCMTWADSKQLSEGETRAFEVVSSYFLSDFPSLAEKTRSSIVEYFYAFANPFNSGMLADYFSQGISPEISPEKTFNGKIIILDFPVKKYLLLGIFAQSIYKRLWQQAVERRDTEKYPTPVFMWVDESQYFLNEDDMLFQTTARSSRACTVMISQNISNYYATIGGKHPKERVNSLLGNLSTKIFHANNDHVTNQWAADTIGKTFQSKTSISLGTNDNTSISEALHYQIEPQEFTTLKSGGKINKFDVESVVTVAGKEWSNGKNYIEAVFNQKD